MDMADDIIIPIVLFKWVQEYQFEKYLQSGLVRPRRNYAHLIDGNLIKGNSFTDMEHIGRWCHSDTCTMLIQIETEGLPNAIYPIPGHRTYLRTMGFLSSLHDPDAWKFESEEIDEFWIEGPIDLRKANASVVWRASEGFPEPTTASLMAKTPANYQVGRR